MECRSRESRSPRASQTQSNEADDRVGIRIHWRGGNILVPGIGGRKWPETIQARFLAHSKTVATARAAVTAVMAADADFAASAVLVAVTV